MNKLELTEQISFLDDKTFDFALPQGWVDDMHSTFNIPYDQLIFSFVWLYDEKARCLGRPYPLNLIGWIACKMAGIVV